MMESGYLPHDWFPAPLPHNVAIGERTWIYSSFAFIHYRSQSPRGLRVGHDSGLYIETFLELGPDGQVEIGDYCTLAGVRICTNGRVQIGNYALISLDVVIADSFAPVPFDHSEAASSRSMVGATSPEIVIEDDAWIGTRAVILGGAHIGTSAIVGAASIVDFVVPDYAIVAGNPARIVGWARPGAPQADKVGQPYDQEHRS